MEGAQEIREQVSNPPQGPLVGPNGSAGSQTTSSVWVLPAAVDCSQRQDTRAIHLSHEKNGTISVEASTHELDTEHMM